MSSSAISFAAADNENVGWAVNTIPASSVPSSRSNTAKSTSPRWSWASSRNKRRRRASLSCSSWKLSWRSSPSTRACSAGGAASATCFAMSSSVSRPCNSWNTIVQDLSRWLSRGASIRLCDDASPVRVVCRSTAVRCSFHAMRGLARRGDSGGPRWAIRYRICAGLSEIRRRHARRAHEPCIGTPRCLEPVHSVRPRSRARGATPGRNTSTGSCGPCR